MMLYDLNSDLKIEREILEGSTIFKIDDFYQDPEEVFEHLFNRDVPLWKMDQSPSLNGIYFEERRLFWNDYRLLKVTIFLSDLCQQMPSGYPAVTNMARYVNNDFNNYKDSYWWPHRDDGYTAIIYFNKDDDVNGTNIYSNEEPDLGVPEHYLPWRSRNKYSHLKTLQPKYNRMYMFDAFKFPHGPTIEDDRYFCDRLYPTPNADKFRCNQPLFFNYRKPL